MKSFPPYPEATTPLETIPLPAGLPVPVDRYYRLTCGDLVR